MQQQFGSATATLADPSYDATGEVSTVTYGNGSRLASSTGGPGITRNNAGALTSLAWQFTDSTAVTDTVTRSRAGRVLTATTGETGQPSHTASYTYDNSARLVTATLPGGRAVLYGFAPNAGCGAMTTAGKNSNRTSETVTIAGVTTSSSYCYDNTDRLTSTSGTLTLNPTYDSRGNTASLGNQSLGYDNADRHVSTTVGNGPVVSTVDYTRDATDRITTRTATNENAVRYSYTADGDTPDLTLTADGGLLERQISLPGGVLLTQRGTAAGGINSADMWSHPNVHGDIFVTADGTGAKTGATRHFDAYGQPLNPSTGELTGSSGVPDTSAGGFDYAWLGQHQRPLEHLTGMLATIEMGARQYSPALGRFLSVDAVEGGSSNDYDYVGADPVNDLDLDGRFSFRKHFKQHWKSYALVAAGFVPGVGLAVWAARGGMAVRTLGAARFGSALYRGPGMGAKSRLFGDTRVTGAARGGLLNGGRKSKWAMGWSGRGLKVNGTGRARAVFRAKVAGRKVDLFHGPWRTPR